MRGGEGLLVGDSTAALYFPGYVFWPLMLMVLAGGVLGIHFLLRRWLEVDTTDDGVVIKLFHVFPSWRIDAGQIESVKVIPLIAVLLRLWVRNDEPAGSTSDSSASSAQAAHPPASGGQHRRAGPLPHPWASRQPATRRDRTAPLPGPTRSSPRLPRSHRAPVPRPPSLPIAAVVARPGTEPGPRTSS